MGVRFNHIGLPIILPELEATTYPDGTRIYKTPSGLSYPSITTVLSTLSEAPLEAWRERIGRDKAAEITSMAATRGTALHSAAEIYLQNGDLNAIDSKTRILLNRIKFILNRINNIVAQEIPLYSDELKVAGRCDLIADFDRELSVVDFKTTIKLKRKEWILNYFLQATGYSLMYQERTGIAIDPIVIIIAGEDGSGAVHMESRSKFIPRLKDTLSDYHNRVKTA